MSNYSEKLKDPRWQKKRLEIFQRDNWTCKFCGDTKSMLMVHHFKYEGDPWEVGNEHLATCCAKCHNEEHEELELAKHLFFSEIVESSVVYNSLTSIITLSRKSGVPVSSVFKLIEKCFEYDDEFIFTLSSLFSERLLKKIKGEN